ncbi:MAG: hypothetical protein B6I38_05665 [Anaerolineaceae bacterium 4572_5.1]|nr:MAG: hypothetical protein B6I38_05665 [Anaerolineaceae bacterium 4572_5.1]
MKEIIQRFPILQKISIVNASAHIALLATAIPGLIDYFKTAHEYRWIALGLYFIFGFLLTIREQAIRQSQMPPALYVAIQTIIIVSLFALPPHHPFVVILFFILSAEASMMMPNRNGYLWLVVFSIITAGFIFLGQGATAALYSLPIYTGGYIFFGAFAATTAKAEAARAESQTLLDELRTAHLKLQDYAAQAEELAVAEERNRLAREMHDTLGHYLTVAIVQLEGAERLIDDEPRRAQGMVATVKEQMRAALSELRGAVATLREPLKTDIPLTSALKHLAKNFEEATGIQVRLVFAHNLPQFPDPYRVALYRAAQEALTNVQRHAQAQNVRLSLMLDEKEGIQLYLRDDGIGLPTDAEKTGFGLLGLKERANQLGGTIRLEANPDGGAQICFCLPWTLEEKDA